MVHKTVNSVCYRQLQIVVKNTVPMTAGKIMAFRRNRAISAITITIALQFPTGNTPIINGVHL